MEHQMKKGIRHSVVFILIALSAGAAAGGQDAGRPAANGQPQAASLIPDLEVTKAAIRGKRLLLEVKNNSTLGVTAVAVTYESTGSGRGSIISDGLLS
jgi:hypothetical protein